MTRVKICGLCRPIDAEAAARAGADYAGVILAPGRARSQSLSRAAEILDAAVGLQRVGVFVNSPVDEVVEAAARLGLDVVQLHGEETPEQVAAIRSAGPWQVWKAVPARAGGDVERALAVLAPHADGLLVDGWSPVASGGAGKTFPWDEVAPFRDRVPAGTTFIMAGGLVPENVGAAVRVLVPDVVDVSSGVESVMGEKSERRIREFVAAARESAQ